MFYVPPKEIRDMPCNGCPQFKIDIDIFDWPLNTRIYCGSKMVSFGNPSNDNIEDVLKELLNECPRSRGKTLIAHLEETTFFKDPASAKYHGACEHGLQTHSWNVLHNLRELTSKHNLTWTDKESMEIIALAHDMCKIGAYIPDGNGGYTYAYPRDRGHGDVSLKLARAVIPLTEEEELCIRWHMGPYDNKENWPKFNAAIKKYPNVFWTFIADMMASQFDEV